MCAYENRDPPARFLFRMFVQFSFLRGPHQESKTAKFGLNVRAEARGMVGSDLRTE